MMALRLASLWIVAVLAAPPAFAAGSSSSGGTGGASAGGSSAAGTSGPSSSGPGAGGAVAGMSGSKPTPGKRKAVETALQKSGNAQSPARDKEELRSLNQISHQIAPSVPVPAPEAAHP